MTVEEAARDFGQVADKIPEIIYQSLFAGANEFNAQMQNRVFNLGKDINGNKIGNYSVSYAAYRRASGKQTAFVDLQYEGDLKRSIVEKRVKGGWEVRFANSTQGDIARENEVRFKIVENTIFAITEQEKKDMIKATEDEFNSRVALAFKDAGF